MLESVLSKRLEELLRNERRWLEELATVLARLGATAEDSAALSSAIRQLEELFLLVVVGEFNSGKSAFINALLGRPLLQEGVTPTTTRITVLRHGERGAKGAEEPDNAAVVEPIELLRYMNIVDTPGTNAIIREHQAVTEEFVPRADLVLFVTSADRPFTESERAFLSRIREWGKKVVVVINKIDIFETEEELAQVVSFVRRNAAVLLSSEPEVFPVSARQALRAKSGRPDLWPGSRFERLEEYVRGSLDEKNRLRLKFLNPLGVADRLIKVYAEITENRMALLAGDIAALDNLERQLEVYRLDTERDFRFRMADIENCLHSMEKRADAYFDETMRLANIMDLVRKDRIQREFVDQVVGGTPAEIEQRVTAVIDWMVGSDLNMWQSVMSHLEQRKREHRDQLIGEVGGTFRYDRDRLIESVGRAAERVVSGYDKNREARKIADNALMAVAGTATGVGVGVGLGALVAALATTAAADVTGIIAAGVLAVLGLIVIPARRRAVKKAVKERMAALRIQLSSALNTQVEKELRKSLQRIQDAVAPYTRFVRAERDRLEQAGTELAAARRRQGRLRAEVESALGAEPGQLSLH